MFTILKFLFYTSFSWNENIYRGGVYPASSCLKISGSYGNLPHCFIVREVKNIFSTNFQTLVRPWLWGPAPWTGARSLPTRRSWGSPTAGLSTWMRGDDAITYNDQSDDAMIRYITGCIEVCDDVDGCNQAQNLILHTHLLPLILIFVTILLS